MSTAINGKPHPHDDNWVPACFAENQQKFPFEELLKYTGQHVAWSWDGTQIVASAPDIDTLYERVAAAGIPSNRVVLDYVDQY